jgi:DNA-binding response OmpR family regulator
MTPPLLHLVDDSQELGLIVASLGKRAGWEVVCSIDAPRAWASLQMQFPDLLLLDINLPGISGLDLCQKIRATPSMTTVPIALFCHWGMSQDIATGLERGADYWISKDLVVSPWAWEARVTEILEHCNGQGPMHSLGYAQTLAQSQPSADWIVTINRALGLGSIRQLGFEVVRFLLRQAVRQAATLEGDLDSEAWLSPEGVTLEAERIPSWVGSKAVKAMVLSLTQQVWRLLGTEGSRAFRNLLATTLSGAAELLAFT